MNISEQVVFSIITDSLGNVHHLPGHPIKPGGFKNRKKVIPHNGNPTYINHENKLVKYDFETGTEIIKIDQSITNFSIKSYSGGDHFIIDATSGVKRIKPDQSEEILTELTPGNYHDIGVSIQYLSGGKFRRMIFDADGNITDRVGRSDPVTFQEWIISGIGGMPTGVLFGGSVSGCTDEMLGSQRIMICNGKALRVGGVDEDLEEINWIDYGHSSLNSWLTPRMCANGQSLYFYAESDFQGNRLTWINDLTGEFRDILDTHQITDLECISNSEVAIIGTIGESIEALSITGSDTVSPVITIIDSQITDIITP